MASASTHPCRVVQDQIQKDQMTKGYPITSEPFVPDIMKHKIDWKVIKNKTGFRKIGFALAPEGSELVEPESLEMIRKKLCKVFSKYFIELPKELETTLPRNTIAVCYSVFNFDVGASCQEFSPIETFQTAEESFLTYQKLSENVQCTYYNQNGNQFLAGVCYYPVPNGHVMYLNNDSALIYLATASSEDYPLCDRSKSYRKVNYNMYGRYCKSSGKRVVVDCSGKYGAIVHVDYNHFTEKYEYVKCTECLEDAATYKWEQPKNETPAPLTRQPFVPDVLKHTVNWRTWVSKGGRPMIGFTEAVKGSEFSALECLEVCKNKLLQWLGNYPEFSEKLKEALPRNTIAISFSEPNFQLGKSCQDFLPLEKFKISDDGFYTYQMISKNVQATYYNENGVEFLAGICWYLPSNAKTISLNRDLKLMNMVGYSAEPFPLEDRNKSFTKIKNNIYGRYCKTAGRRVAIDCSGTYGTIRHIDVHSTFDKYDYTACEECLEDYFTYKWAEPTKEQPSPVTRHPTVPDTLRHAAHWKTWLTKAGVPKVGITQAADDLELAVPESLETCRDKLQRWLKNYPEFSKELETSLPRNTIAVSFAQYNFKVGKSCQEFLPSKQFKISDDAFYTYQMISKNMQATYYNENGVVFLAGICWYLPSNAKTINLNRDLKFIYLAQCSAEPFPLEDRNKSFTKIKNHIYGRYCKTAGRRVAIDCSGKNGTIRHIDVNSTYNKYEYTACEECLEDYFTYKWMESKKKNPASIDSPKPSEATESLTTEETVQSNISPSITTVSSTPTKEGPVLLDTPKPADSSTLLSDTAELSVATLSLEDKTSMSPASSTESLLKDFDKIEESATYDEEFDAEIIN